MIGIRKGRHGEPEWFVMGSNLLPQLLDFMLQWQKLDSG